MIATAMPHPSADELRAYGEGRLDPEAADHVERHIGECDSCCRLLEGAPADSFVGRLRDARRPAVDTTADPALGTLTDAPAVPPELIDHPRYRVLGLIGQGGMGAVYRAEHRRMERPVALKVINPGLMRNPATVERFQQEVRAAARLHHANIVTAHDADQAGGLHFLVMEHVEGKSLADLVQERGPVPVAEACEYVRQAALGLQHAHEQGMVHRDVKPHNLMLTLGGVVKILDFGLARLARTSDASAAGGGTVDASLTGAGVVMGSADYIAPEQAADPRTADIRADIYALGCTLFHLLAGRPPFPEGTVQEKLARHAKEPLPPLSALLPGLAAVVARMTAKDPEQRFATPAEVARELAPFCVPGRVRPPTRKWLRRVVAVAALLVAGLLVAGIVLRLQTDRGEIVVQTDDKHYELTVRKNGEIIRIHDSQSGDTWDVNTKHYQIAAANKPGGLVIELPGRGTIALRRKGGGTVTVTSGPKGVAVEKPGPTRLPTAEELAQRLNAADALKPGDVPEVARAYVGGGDPKKAPPELVAVWTAAPAPPADVRFRCPKGAGRPAFSPDGKLLAVPSEGMVLFFDTASGRLVRSAKGLWDLRDRVVFSPDGRKLAVGSKAEDFSLLDVGTGKALWKLEDIKLPTVDGFSFSADGKQIAFSSASFIGVRAVGTGKRGRSFRGPGKKIVSMAFTTEPAYFASVALGAVNPWQVNVYSFELPPGSGYGTQFSHRGVRVAFRPNGKLLAVAHKEEKGGTYTVSFYRPDDRFSKPCGFQPVPGADVLAFTPDGKELVAGAFQGGNIVIGRCQVPTGKIFETKTVVLPWKGPAEWAVSPDGKTLAVSVKGDPFVRLIDVETGKLRVSDAEHTGAVIALACSADGKRLVSVWEDSRVIVWNLATGRPVVRWKLDIRLRRLAISPDGRLIATACEAPANSATTEDWVHLWDANGGIATRVLVGHAGAVTDLAFSPDGRLLATASADHTVRLWRVEDGKEVAGVVHPQKVQAVAWSADGQILASWSTDGTWIVRELGTLTEHRHTDQTPPWSAAFDLEGRRLAILSINGVRPVVGLYQWKEWKGNERSRGLTGPRAKLKGGPGASALGPGPFLAAVADRLGGSLLVWQTQPLPNPSREKQFTLAPPGSGPLRCVAFSPEGRYVMAGGADGLIRVLRLAERGKVPEFPPSK